MHIYVFYFATTTIARVFSRVVVVIRVIQHRHRRRNVNIDNTGSIISTVPNIIIHRRMRVRMQRRIISPLHSPKESHYSFLFSLFREHICCCHSKNGGSFLSRLHKYFLSLFLLRIIVITITVILILLITRR